MSNDFGGKRVQYQQSSNDNKKRQKVDIDSSSDEDNNNNKEKCPICLLYIKKEGGAFKTCKLHILHLPCLKMYHESGKNKPVIKCPICKQESKDFVLTTSTNKILSSSPLQHFWKDILVAKCNLLEENNSDMKLYKSLCTLVDVPRKPTSMTATQHCCYSAYMVKGHLITSKRHLITSAAKKLYQRVGEVFGDKLQVSVLFSSNIILPTLKFNGRNKEGERKVEVKLECPSTNKVEKISHYIEMLFHTLCGAYLSEIGKPIPAMPQSLTSYMTRLKVELLMKSFSPFIGRDDGVESIIGLPCYWFKSDLKQNWIWNFILKCIYWIFNKAVLDDFYPNAVAVYIFPHEEKYDDGNPTAKDRLDICAYMDVAYICLRGSRSLKGQIDVLTFMMLNGFNKQYNSQIVEKIAHTWEFLNIIGEVLNDTESVKTDNKYETSICTKDNKCKNCKAGRLTIARPDPYDLFDVL